MSPKARRSKRPSGSETRARKAPGASASFSPGVEGILRSTAQRAAQLLGVSRAAVFMWDGEATILRAGPRYLSEPDGRDEEWRGIEIPIPDRRVVERTIASRKSLVLHRAKRVSGISELLRVWRAESVMVVPLLWEGELLGILVLDEPQEKKALGPEKVENLVSFAGLAAMAVENAKLLGVAQRQIAERERTEEALRRSRQLWERMLYSLLDAVFILDADRTAIMDCNAAAWKLFGYSREEMLGRTTAFLHVDEAALEEFRRHLYPSVEKKGFLSEFEFHMKRKDGTVFPTEHSVSPVEDEEGRRIGWVSVVRDITERKRAQEEYATILRSTQDGFWIIDGQGRFLDVNDAYCRLIGYRRDELLKMSVFDVEAAESPEEIAQRLRRGAETGGERFESWHRRKDGSIVDLEISVGYTEISGGRGYAFARDITERKRAAEEYAAILSTTVDSFWITDAQGRFLDVNDAYCRLIGYSRDELLTMSVRDVVERESPEETAERLRRVAKTGMELFESQHRCKDGKVVDLEVRISYSETRGGRGYVFARDITERKRAQEEYATILLTTLDGFWIMDTQGRFLDVNDAYCRLIGYSRDELLKMGIPDVEAVESPEETAQRIRRVVETGGQRFETRHRCKGGRIVDVEVSVNYLEAAGGRVYVFIRDITERKRAADEYAAILHTTADSFWIVDGQGRFLDVNDAYCRLMGYSRDELLTMGIRDVVVGESLEESKQRVRWVVEGGGDHFESRHRCKDGRIVDLEVSISYAQTGGGRGYVFARDITERKRAQEEYATILRTTVDSFWIVDTQGRFLDVNDAYCRLIGYSRDELLKMGIPDVEAVESREETAQRIRRVVETGGDRFETRQRCKDGRVVDLEVSIGYVETGGGRGYVFARDITERKTGEDALRRYAGQLEALREVGLGLTAQLDLDPLLHSIVARAVELVGGTSGGLHLYRQERDLLEWAVALGPESPSIGAVLHRGEGLSGKVWETGKPLIVDDYQRWEGRGPIFERVPLGAVIGVPVRWGEEFLGVLNVLADSPGAFSAPDAELLGLFATQVAIAIKNARLFSSEEQRAKQFEGLYRTSLELASLENPSSLLKTVVGRAADLLGAKAGGLYTYDPIAGELEMVVSHNLDRDRRGTRLELGEGLSGRVAQSGEPLAVDSYGRWEGSSDEFVDGEPGAVLGVPLKRGETLLGVLFLDRKASGRFDERDVRLASLFANQAAIAIENSRLYEQTDEKLQLRVAELAAINAIVEAVIKSLDLRGVLDVIVEKTAQVMKARVCTIRMVQGDELSVVAATGHQSELLSRDREKIGQSVGHLVKNSPVVMVKDLWKAEDVPKRSRERAKKAGVRSLLAVPLMARERLMGVLTVYGEKAGLFGERETSLLSSIANQAALAIGNTQLYDDVRRHAAELEVRVEERTRELQMMQLELIQSAKLAALGQLAAGVAHELNNPLGAISGYVELLQEEGRIEGPASDYLERVQGRIEQATKIVQELRGFGTPKEPTRQLVEMGRVLEDALDLVKPDLSSHRIRVHKRIATRLGRVLADPHQLEQVFLNLIVNARQAMKEGGALRLIARQAAGGEWVEVIVADRGEGIRPEHLSRVFDPFFTTRAPGEGTGLGLSVSYRIIRDHEGAIDVWSKIEVGTIFRVSLPTKKAKRCWEIMGCGAEKECKVGAEKAAYRCWTAGASGYCKGKGHGLKGCGYCPVFLKKVLPSLDKRLLPPKS